VGKRAWTVIKEGRFTKELPLGARKGVERNKVSKGGTRESANETAEQINLRAKRSVLTGRELVWRQKARRWRKRGKKLRGRILGAGRNLEVEGQAHEETAWPNVNCLSRVGLLKSGKRERIS